MRTLDNLLASPGNLAEEEKASLSLFLFAFHASGMCFVDLAHLKKEDVGRYIGYYRKKTGQYLEVRVNGKMREYMRMFRDNGTEYVFPVIREEGEAYRQYCSGLKRQNMLLKRIGRKAGLSKPLTTHLARHSWATIAKREGVSVGVISESLGHSSVETTYRYLDSFGRTALDKAGDRVTKAVSGKS